MATNKYFKAKLTRQYFGKPKIIKDSAWTEKELKETFPTAIINADFEEITESVYTELLTAQQKAKLSEKDALKLEIEESLKADYEKKYKIQEKKISELTSKIKELEGKK